jgi:pilus assembly protein Flp/PilA
MPVQEHMSVRRHSVAIAPTATSFHFITRSLLQTRINTMNAILSRFAKDESGATAIEYGLIAGLISVVIIAAITLIGTNLKTKFNLVASALT